MESMKEVMLIMIGSKKLGTDSLVCKKAGEKVREKSKF